MLKHFMGKILVLAEKPSVGRELASVLGCRKKCNGYIEGEKYRVTWALGHLVTLASPEKYDKSYEHWNKEQLPIMPEKMKLEVIKETRPQYNIVKTLLKSDDTDSLIIATDAGREGELVARWIMEKAGFKKPVKRLWISSQTEKAVKDGFNNLKDGKEYENLYKSGQCRAVADWLVGLNISRALTCKFNASLSAGRVQTPTLYMITEREKEISSFKPREYYTLDIKSENIKLKWRAKSGDTKIFDEDFLVSLMKKLKGSEAVVTNVKKEEKSEPSPQLYDLTELQRDANKIYKYSAKKTLSIMQSLYEKHKIVTYPRTDSKYLSDDIIPSFAERLSAISINNYSKIIKSINLDDYKPDKRFIDNAKVTDHHAIIPTEQPVNWYALTDEEKNIFDLVAKRFLCMFLPRYKYLKISIEANAVGEQFFANGRTVKENGWRGLSNIVSDEEETEIVDVIPPLNINDRFLIKDVTRNKAFTQPPSRYTEASILYAMENAGKFINDSDMKNVLKEVSGIGTPATRADIIEKLVTSLNVERVNNTLVPTKKAMQLVNLVPDDLKSPELTAKWEKKLSDISSGKEKPKLFLENIKEYTQKLVTDTLNSAKTYKHDNITKEKCPECGEFLLEINSKKGKMLVCSNPACHYRKHISQNSKLRCPECHKFMTLYGTGENKIFRCTCGFRKKLSDTKTDKVGKYDVKNYLKKQKQEDAEFSNNALAEALKKALKK